MELLMNVWRKTEGRMHSPRSCWIPLLLHFLKGAGFFRPLQGRDLFIPGHLLMS